MSSEADVIIVGAGAAGLAAARESARLGLTCRLVEGSHRIGGRAYSEEIAPGVWFDLGCSYLHQAESNPFVDIADEMGIEVGREHGDIFDDDELGLYRNGKPLDAGERRACLAYHAACYEAVRAASERGDDVAIADLVELDSPYIVPFANSMAALNTLDIDQTSCTDFAAAGGGSDFPLRNGYGNLVAAWGADVPVTLNSRAERIRWGGKHVVVETSRGTLRARAALCTVSTGILMANEIAFDPALPEWKTRAVHGLPTGTENKICLHFARDVFGPDGRGFHIAWNDAGISAGFEASVTGLDTAVVFTGGRHAVWLEKQGQQAGEDFALDRVAEVFGNDIRRHLTRSIVTAWSGDPWTRGAYSCALPGQAHQRRELARPLADRLFFAGEATTVGDHACCHGAFNSGIRAAREIRAALG